MTKLAPGTIGDKAEVLSAEFLTRQGIKIIDKNYRSRFGEIDLIANHADTLVFVEVRYRRDTRFGQPFETVTRQKQKKLVNTALNYLQQHPKLAKKPCRFDIISVTSGEQPIEWIQNAFDISTFA